MDKNLFQKVWNDTDGRTLKIEGGELSTLELASGTVEELHPYAIKMEGKELSLGNYRIDLSNVRELKILDKTIDLSDSRAAVARLKEIARFLD